MSTPESKGGPPQGLPPVGELSLLQAHLPRTTETPNYPTAATTSTPGIALAAARVPGGPSLPELDPLSLTNAISQLANQMFAAPPAPASGVPATMDTSALSTAQPTHAPSPPATQALTPNTTVAPVDPSSSATSASPFHAAPNFAWMDGPHDPFGSAHLEELLRFPLREPTT